MYWDYNRIDRASGPITLTGTTAVTFASGGPVDVKRVILVMTTANSVARTVNFGVRNVDDSSSVTLGSFVVPITPINGVVHAVVAEQGDGNVTTGADGSAVNGPAWGIIQLDPGQEFWIAAATASGTGIADVHVEYIVQGYSGERVEDTAQAVVTRVA